MRSSTKSIVLTALIFLSSIVTLQASTDDPVNFDKYTCSFIWGVIDANDTEAMTKVAKHYEDMTKKEGVSFEEKAEAEFRLAQMYFHLEKYDLANERIQQYMSMKSKDNEPSAAQMALILHYTSNLLLQKVTIVPSIKDGILPKAKEMQLSSIQILKEIPGLSDPLMPRALNFLGVILTAQGEYGEAFETFHKAMHLINTHQQDNYYLRAGIFANISSCCLALAKSKKAAEEAA